MDGEVGQSLGTSPLGTGYARRGDDRHLSWLSRPAGRGEAMVFALLEEITQASEALIRRVSK